MYCNFFLIYSTPKKRVKNEIYKRRPPSPVIVRQKDISLVPDASHCKKNMIGRLHFLNNLSQHLVLKVFAPTTVSFLP